MHFVGWAVALLAIGVLAGPEETWAVAVLATGPVLLLVALRAYFPRQKPPEPPAGPRSIDVEALRIRDLQSALDERASIDEREQT